MKLREIPLRKLRQMLSATERVAGADSVAVRILRRELDRRVTARLRRRAQGDDHAD